MSSLGLIRGILGVLTIIHIILTGTGSKFGEELGFPKLRGFPKLGVPLLGDPYNNGFDIFWGQYWGPILLGNYHVGLGILNSEP